MSKFKFQISKSKINPNVKCQIPKLKFCHLRFVFCHYFVICALLFGILINGCAPLIIGGALGAAGGYVISKDTIQGVIERSYDSAWEASINVLKEMGAADFEYNPGGKFRTYVKDTKVNVKVEQMSEKSIRLTVSARKGLLPRLKLAEEVFIKVVERNK